jgi:hypothetical protein
MVAYAAPFRTQTDAKPTVVSTFPKAEDGSATQQMQSVDRLRLRPQDTA